MGPKKTITTSTLFLIYAANHVVATTSLRHGASSSNIENERNQISSSHLLRHRDSDVDQISSESAAPQLPSANVSQNYHSQPRRENDVSVSTNDTQDQQGYLPQHRLMEETAQCQKDGKWHTAMGVITTCSNDDKYPPSWDEPTMSSFFYNTWKECCDESFNSFQNSMYCGVVDACGASDDPEIGKTIGVDNYFGVYDDDHPCKGRSWHPDTGTAEPVCTNDLEYPASWSNVVMKGITMFDTVSECCEKLKGSCRIKEDEMCAKNSKSSSTEPSSPDAGDADECSLRRWHFSLTTPKTCTNDKNYPSVWDEESHLNRTMFHTADDCCYIVKNRPDVSTCDIVNDCPITSDDGGDDADSSCIHAKYHPSINPAQKITCTNSMQYPEQWESNEDRKNMFFHENPADCCKSFYPDAAECVVEDVCSSSTTSTSATQFSTTIPDQMSTTSTTTTTLLTTTPISSSTTTIPKTSSASTTHTSMGTTAVPNSSQTTTSTIPATTLSSFITTTSTNSVCETTDYHPSIDPHSPQTCTNSMNFPLQWKDDTQINLFFHKDPADCCNRFFKYAPKCYVEDICASSTSSTAVESTTTTTTNTPQPAPSPTPNPTEKPIINDAGSDSSPPTSQPTSSPMKCMTYKWHSKGPPSKTCSDDIDYPSAWDNPLVSADFLFDTAEECCAKFFGSDECTALNSCEKTSFVIQPTLNDNSSSCSGKKYHPINIVSRKCTNDDDMPPLWRNDPVMSAKYLLDSAEECCSTFYSDGECDVVNICATGAQTTTTSTVTTTSLTRKQCKRQKKWHPTNAVDRTCTNDDNYPSIWHEDAEMREKYLLKTAKECCAAFYSSGDCEIVNIC